MMKYNVQDFLTPRGKEHTPTLKFFHFKKIYSQNEKNEKMRLLCFRRNIYQQIRHTLP